MVEFGISFLGRLSVTGYGQGTGGRSGHTKIKDGVKLEPASSAHALYNLAPTSVLDDYRLRASDYRMDTALWAKTPSGNPSVVLF